MKLAVGMLLMLFTIALSTPATYAVSATITGSISVGSDGAGVEAAFEGSWNDASDFTCTNESPFVVTAVSGPCGGKAVPITFEVNDGQSTTSAAHTFEYRVECVEVEGVYKMFQDLAFDGAELANIDDGSYVFNLDLGGDKIVAHTGRELLVVPTLGQWSMVALVAIILASGVYVVVRRYRARPQPS